MDVMSRKRGPEGLPRSGDEGKRPRLDCRMSDTEDSLGSDTDADESDEVSDPEGSRPPGLAVKGVVWASKSLEVRDLRVRCSGSESLALIGREALDIRGLLKRSDVEDRVEVVGSEEGAVHENPDNTSSGDPAWAFKSTEIRDLRVRCSGSESLALIGPEALDIRGLLKRSEDEDDRVENVEKRSQDGEDRLEYVGSEESAVQEKRDQLSSGDPPGVNESSPELSKSGSFESARSGDSSGLVEHGSPRGSDSRAAMFERFQRWVQETYSAQTKTKTITQLKYDRIVRTLHGLIPNVAGNSKFRFWIRTKGFHLATPDAQGNEQLFVASRKEGVGGEPVYKRVAVVERFFDIIYGVHVELEGRGGRHAGQKRTYRAITESYAFLPREAVTKFLLGCDCQRRTGEDGGDRSGSGNGNQTSSDQTPSPGDQAVPSGGADHDDATPKGVSGGVGCLRRRRLAESGGDSALSSSTPDSSRSRISYSTISRSSDVSDLSPIDSEPAVFQRPYPRAVYTVHPTTLETVRLPLRPSEISVRYERNRPFIRAKGAAVLGTYLRTMRSLGYSDEESLRLDDQEIRSTPEPDPVDDHYQGRNGDLSPGEEGPGGWPYHGALGAKKPTPPISRDIPSPATLQETGSVHDETSSSGNKEDDDDDEEEMDDLKAVPHDSERLKAFNMFVRLFVDENLDRIVPISKQPKEKIQAIIDSCTRQFPEFAERARKRIRTYLKSCRRNKRTRDSSWPESNRPTPAHLTSVQAEQILAQACENESHNAKRMRLGLDPLSQPLPLLPGGETPPSRPSHESFSAASLASSAANSESKPQQHQPSHPLHLNNNKPESPNLAKAAEPPPATISSMSSSPLNGVAPSPLFRPNFGQAFSRAAGPQPPFPPAHLFPNPPFGAPAIMHNGPGPTDLSMKQTKPLLSHKLSTPEMAAVRQLITGYRESAAFLLRSAEELEQLLLQQP